MPVFPRVGKVAAASICSIALSGAAFADCTKVKTRGSLADKIEIIFKNDTQTDIRLEITKSDFKDPSEASEKVVQSKIVAAETKADYSGNLGDNAKKRFEIRYGSDLSSFTIENEKASKSGTNAKSTYSGAYMPRDSSSRGISCDASFKANSNRWSVKLTVSAPTQ
ncbi:MAG: hypothetical protein AAGL90_13985 [Pseudomonadota bacterium]